MEIGNDLLASLRHQLDPSRGGDAEVVLDWAGLHARCTAAHAARRVLQDGQVGRTFPSGGFGDWARVASSPGIHTSRYVNRTGSADGKFPAGNGDSVAREPVAGGRGQQ